MEVEAHAEFPGDGVRLVEAAAAGAADVELLERHDVGPRSAITAAIRSGESRPSVPRQLWTL